MSHNTLVAWSVIAVVLTATQQTDAKDHSRFVTAGMRANVQANALKYEWVRQRQERAMAAAEFCVKRTDDELWAMVPAQELPRTIYTNKGVIYEGQKPYCPGCGDAAPAKYGRSWWQLDEGRPWKVHCKNCNEVYPKNDFEAFYKSALDERGMFRRQLGDRSLLVNGEHPDPKDPLHKLHVDDGYGMLDEKGNRHDIVAYYCWAGVWQRIKSGVAALAEAYALTGDSRYAHKAAVLLDRIADVYPEMDYLPLHRMGFQHSQGGTGLGRIDGCIWECAVAQRLAHSYDVIFDGIQNDEQLATFCSNRAKQHKLGNKNSIRAICRHIEDHLLLEALKSCKDGRISGNTGMTHTCLAANAIALDRTGVTEEWLDWLFHPGFPGHKRWGKDPVPWVLVEGLDRDGMGGENGGYGLIWTRSMHELVEILAAYPEYTKHDLVADYPKLKQSYFVQSRLNVLDSMMPNTGDSGAVGNWGRQGNAATYMRAFALYRDPRFANLAWREHNTHKSSLRLSDDIYRNDPDALIREVEKTASNAALSLKSEHFGRYGQMQLQTEDPDNGRAVFIHYGQDKGHSHHDCLNIGLLAKNVAMIPDLGYPEYTGSWPKRHAWTANTISHNTLQIGDTRSVYSPGGNIELFVSEPPLRVMQVDAPNAYKNVQTYRRTVALVDIDDRDSYVLDVFRACGGRNHRLSWHGAAEMAQTNGLTLLKHETGTFAGPDAPFAKLDGEHASFYQRSGFTYLYDVERSDGRVDAPYTVDWQIDDKRGRIRQGAKPCLRLHALTPCDEVALASGDSPHRFLRPRYVIQSRLGENKRSQFVNILEPYDKTPFVKQVRPLKVEHNADEDAVAAVAVDLADGRTDVLITCGQPTAVKVEGDIDFNGTFGMIRLVDSKTKLMRLIGGTLIAHGETQLTATQAEWRGKVLRIDASDAENSLVLLDPPLPQDAGLVGRTIHFINDLPMDTSYDIRAITPDGISTGDITIVRGFRNRADFSSGYTYLVGPGDEYVVPAVGGIEHAEGR